jgi:hypothetical protein
MLLGDGEKRGCRSSIIGINLFGTGQKEELVIEKFRPKNLKQL